jgi:hypothetical protein
VPECMGHRVEELNRDDRELFRQGHRQRELHPRHGRVADIAWSQRAAV